MRRMETRVRENKNKRKMEARKTRRRRRKEMNAPCRKACNNNYSEREGSNGVLTESRSVTSQALRFNFLL